MADCIIHERSLYLQPLKHPLQAQIHTQSTHFPIIIEQEFKKVDQASSNSTNSLTFKVHEQFHLSSKSQNHRQILSLHSSSCPLKSKRIGS